MLSLQDTNTVLLKMLGASPFYSIKYSILKLLSPNLVCMSIFDIQKYILNFFRKIVQNGRILKSRGVGNGPKKGVIFKSLQVPV